MLAFAVNSTKKMRAGRIVVIPPVVVVVCALALASCAISHGALAALQRNCDAKLATDLGSIWGFSQNMPCKTLLRFYWFIMAMELILVPISLLAIITGAISKCREALVGLVVITTVLYILWANAFLTAAQMDDIPQKSTISAMIAGGIMTATMNCSLIMALGTDFTPVP